MHCPVTVDHPNPPVQPDYVANPSEHGSQNSRVHSILDCAACYGMGNKQHCFETKKLSTHSNCQMACEGPTRLFPFTCPTLGRPLQTLAASPRPVSLGEPSSNLRNSLAAYETHEKQRNKRMNVFPHALACLRAARASAQLLGSSLTRVCRRVIKLL